MLFGSIIGLLSPGNLGRIKVRGLPRTSVSMDHYVWWGRKIYAQSTVLQNEAGVRKAAGVLVGSERTLFNTWQTIKELIYSVETAESCSDLSLRHVASSKVVVAIDRVSVAGRSNPKSLTSLSAYRQSSALVWTTQQRPGVRSCKWRSGRFAVAHA